MRLAVLAGVLWAAAAVTFIGCDSKSAQARGPANATYVVRGKVEMVPEAGQPTSGFVLHHEPIDNFQNPDGTVGMGSMIMPMPLGKGVETAGVRVGDVVRVTLDVWTTPGQRGFEVRTLEKLDPETVLRFGPPDPARSGAGMPGNSPGR